MPGRNRTGPFGQGPMSGRGLGYCGGAEANPEVGRGFGPGRGGRGRGHGWRHQFWATGIPGWARFAGASNQPEPSPEFEKEALRSKAKQLQQQMDLINARLKELETTDNETSNQDNED